MRRITQNIEQSYINHDSMGTENIEILSNEDLQEVQSILRIEDTVKRDEEKDANERIGLMRDFSDSNLEANENLKAIATFEQSKTESKILMQDSVASSTPGQGKCKARLGHRSDKRQMELTQSPPSYNLKSEPDLDNDQLKLKSFNLNEESTDNHLDDAP